MKRLLEIITNGGMYVLTAFQVNEIFQMIELILSIVMTLFILTINIIAWVKKSMEDGKIDKKEIEELKEIAEKGKEDLEKIKK